MYRILTEFKVRTPIRTGGSFQYMNTEHNEESNLVVESFKFDEMQ